MKLSQLLTGMIFILFGLFLIILYFFLSKDAWVALMYGIPIFIIGFFIFFNKKEDKIEQIKKIKKKKHKGGRK
jgi:hypothetical protein